jgi:rSAM/selenodomain-associated transferase 2
VLSERMQGLQRSPPWGGDGVIDCMPSDSVSPTAPSEPRLTAIIPAWQEAATIAATVRSVRAAGFDEIIVVDGGSADATVELARAAGADRVLSVAPGRASQQNAGADLATGDVLCFLHADCRPDSRSGAALRKAFGHPEVCAASFVQRIDAPGWAYRWLEWGNLRRVLWWRMGYGDQGLCVRRTTFEVVGRFPPWPLMEDVALSLRLRGQGRWVVLSPPLVVSARRWERRGIVRQTLTNWLIVGLFACGVSPERLARLYRHVR